MAQVHDATFEFQHTGVHKTCKKCRIIWYANHTETEDLKQITHTKTNMILLRRTNVRNGQVGRNCWSRKIKHISRPSLWANILYFVIFSIPYKTLSGVISQSQMCCWPEVEAKIRTCRGIRHIISNMYFNGDNIASAGGTGVRVWESVSQLQ